MATPVALRHLVLIPAAGMCNRLRAIASARRLCALVQARCSIVWDWATLDQFFAPMSDVEIVPAGSIAVEKKMRHHREKVDPSRSVDVEVKSVELISGHVFWGSHEKQVVLAEIKPWLPRLNARLQTIVDEFATAHLRNTVGFHMRRTDSVQSMAHSPDALFFEHAHEVIARGKKIFLGTDNGSTEVEMKRRFGDAVITYPKRTPLRIRWPREFDPVAAEDDLIDLFLLSKTEYVVGSYFSSYSATAIALNGSKECRILKMG